MTYPRMAIPEPYSYRVRAKLRKIPTWRLEEAYEALGASQATGIEIVEANRAYALSAIREILWERGKLPPEETELAADIILESQRRLRENFRRLFGVSQQAFRKPFQALDEDVKRIRKAWGL